MEDETHIRWPSGDCKPILATKKAPSELVGNAKLFRGNDDLDWFDGAWLRIDDFGYVLLMRHDNNPEQLTALYVDVNCDALQSESKLIEYFALEEGDIFWKLSDGGGG